MTDQGITINGKKMGLSPEIEQLAAKVLAENSDLDIEPAAIQYMKVYPFIDKKTAAKCVKAQPLVQFFGACHYIIQVSGQLWDLMDEAEREILLYHELLHVKPVYNEKKDTYTFQLRDHDIQEFSEVVRKHGIDWLDSVKEKFAEVLEEGSVPDMSL